MPLLLLLVLVLLLHVKIHVIHVSLFLELLLALHKVPTRAESAVCAVKNCDIRPVVVVECDEGL